MPHAPRQLSRPLFVSLRLGVRLGCAALACGVLGCGAVDPQGPQEAVTAPEAATAPAGYSLHEWGVITSSALGTHVNAGPPRAPQPVLVVEKPVLYVHTEEPLDLRVALELGPGYDLREIYPRPAGLAFDVHATPGACAAPHAYPRGCETTSDGICEVTELRRYETADAACLRVGEAELPLLFYRLGASAPQPLPVEVRVEGPRVFARARVGEVQVYRITHAAGQVRAVGLLLGEAWTELPAATVEWSSMAWTLEQSLLAAGLTSEERGAFRRAWWAELFGSQAASAAAPERVSASPRQTAAETPEGNRPPIQEAQAAQDVTEEVEDMEEYDPESALMERSGRPSSTAPDVLLYRLSDAQIDTIVRVRATPTPGALRRAFYIRQVL